MKKILIIWALLISVVFAQSKAGFYVVGGKVITVQDNDSKAYLKAVENAGVTPTTNQNFTSNYLVTTQKEIGTWSLIVAQYPFIGGTAATHKFNMKDPRDLDAAYRISFGAGTSHSSTGATATTNNSNTFINGSLLFTNNIHLSYYSGTNSTPVGNNGDLGFYGSGSQALYMSIKRLNGVATGFSAYSEGAAGVLVPYAGRSDGYFLGSRVSNSLSFFMRNGVLITQSLAPGGTIPNGNIAVLGVAGAGATPSPRQARYASVGFGFTSTQALQQSHIVTFSQSLLGRQ